MDAKLQAALDLITAALQGVALPDPDNGPGGWLIPKGTAPTVPIDPATADEGELKRYAVWGVKADLTRGVAPSDFPAMLKIAEAILLAQSQEQAEAAIKRASLFPPEVACYLVLTGATQGFSTYLSPTISAPPNVQTIRDAALYATFRPISGPGPGL